jgi:rod shape-determining protein MreB
VREGQIEDYEGAEALLLHLVRSIPGRNRWMSPRMVVAVPGLATEMERRAVRECCESVGGREVHLIPKPVAAALGAGLPVHEPAGQMVVDIGGGSTEVSVVSLNGVVSSQVVPGGGGGMDRAIVRMMKDRHNLLIGARTAESIKIELGTALGGDPSSTRLASGRCLETGLPRSVRISAADVETALSEPVAAIATTIRRALERTPPELASDVVDHGVVLTGAGCLLRSLDGALRELTGLAVVRAENPAGAVVEGAGRVLEELDLMQALAS